MIHIARVSGRPRKTSKRLVTREGAATIAKMAATLAVALALGSCASQIGVGAYDAQTRFTPEELRGDFRRFRHALENEAIGLYADHRRLGSMLDEAESGLVEPMTELEFFRRLSPLVAELHCGHSSLSLSKRAERRMRKEGLFFPLELRIYGERLFVIKDRYATGIALGSEILAINEKPAAEIIDAILSRMTSDGKDRGRLRYDAERHFAAMYQGYIDAPERFALRLRRPGELLDRLEEVQAVQDPALATTPLAIMRDTLNAPYGGTIGESHAILVIPCFGISDTKAYASWLEGFFEELKEKKIPSLILDLRGNYGGSPEPTVELFKYLIDRPLPFFAEDNPIYLAPWKTATKPSPSRFSGSLYVLMDEAGFSMNGFLLSLLKYHKIGTLIGAASSGGYRCSDASRETTLPATGLRLIYSTRAFSVAVEGQESGVGVAPDIAVSPTLEDWISGRDPVLETALSLAGPLSIRENSISRSRHCSRQND